MKGRSRRTGNQTDVGGCDMDQKASMKGRSRRTGNRTISAVRGIEQIEASMKGRSRRTGNLPCPGARCLDCGCLNEGPVPEDR